MTYKTHEVKNQVPPRENFDAVQHPVYDEFLKARDAHASISEIHEFGRVAGSLRVQRLADLVEKNQPVLNTHDKYGHRVDQVEYDPAYHELMNIALANGLDGTPWQDKRNNAHLIRAVKFVAWQSGDVGHTCPVTMTYAAVAALRTSKELAAEFEPLLSNGVYDSTFSSPAQKAGLTAGMSMTEKQGGSDVRANSTLAEQQSDGSYQLTGHKWFTSAPMSDILLTLAQAPGGLTCFVVPRILPDGTVNSISLMRLKDKLGNLSNASSEIEYMGATGWRLGDEGRGVRTIVEMVNMTRLDVTQCSAAIMMNGLAKATHHVRHREAFGDKLINKPLMRNVIADLAVEAEAAALSGMWLAALTDEVEKGDSETLLLRRIGLAALKYYVAKRTPEHVAESLECLGGNGYIEDSGMPRLYREAPLGSIWEGTGNVAALDVIRVLKREPEALEAVYNFLGSVAGFDHRYDDFVEQLKSAFDAGADLEFNARTIAGDLSVAIQAALLRKFGNSATTEVFYSTRLIRRHGAVYGTLPSDLGVDEVVARAMASVD
ncbi:acyl-CoA dehydrogenase family protein [Marinobacter sp. 1-3A]|uniref:acyl-CoA dehydrogenase family protein n=1 Tax=Marinobacter sp. 1-3A TaxID=2582920 RepID=UPI00190774BD|nr:acyl-CoA dehydrogenase family protein [Marinobacter sp. 1-3A]MBK1875131.1 acyl-CoA dehydrogenase family protein [Marinobacter sp. 1-3A]